MNPQLGQYEIETVLQMTDDDFEMWGQRRDALSPKPGTNDAAHLQVIADPAEIRWRCRGSRPQRDAGQRRRCEGSYRLRDTKAGALGDHRFVAGWTLLVTAAVRSRSAKTLGSTSL
jgi:hypothetical protein